MHSSVERASHDVEIYTSSQWAAVIRGAKHRKPHYKVNELDTTDFLDFKKVAAILVNFYLDVDKSKVNWMNIRRTMVTKEKPNSFLYSESPAGEYKEVNLLQRVRKTVTVDPNDIELLSVNNGKPTGIDKEKKRDLMSLCEQQLIPRVHHPFFEALKTKIERKKNQMSNSSCTMKHLIRRYKDRLDFENFINFKNDWKCNY